MSDPLEIRITEAEVEGALQRLQEEAIYPYPSDPLNLQSYKKPHPYDDPKYSYSGDMRLLYLWVSDYFRLQKERMPIFLKEIKAAIKDIEESQDIQSHMTDSMKTLVNWVKEDLDRWMQIEGLSLEELKEDLDPSTGPRFRVRQYVKYWCLIDVHTKSFARFTEKSTAEKARVSAENGGWRIYCWESLLEKTNEGF